MPEIILLNKPFNCLSQFTSNDGKTSLADVFMENGIGGDYYPAGRLDYDSEGLLILTNSGALQHRIANPDQKMAKTYWVQVEGPPNTSAIQQLQKGVRLNDGLTLPAKVSLINAPTVWQRTPPIRVRADIPTHWLSITIKEGRNRQVRRMTAAVGLPTLRLIRTEIGHWQLRQLLPGEFRVETVHLPISSRDKNRIKRP